MMSNVLSQYWWMILLRGVLSILFGLVLFAQPGISLVTLTLLFGAFALVHGVGNVISALSGRNRYASWWVLLIAGLAGILVGVLTFTSPGITALVLLYYIAGWAIATGIFEMVAAIHLRKEIVGEFWLALGGLASVAFGLVVIARPGVGALTVVWLIGSYAVAFGVILVLLAFKARGFVSRVRSTVHG